MSRFTMANLLASVAVLALGLTALRDASTPTAYAVYSLTLTALFVGLLGALVRPAPAGAWRGFALFGCGYFLMAFLPFRNGPFDDRADWFAALLPTVPLVDAVVARLHPEIRRPASPFADFEPVLVNDVLSRRSATGPSGYEPLSGEEVKSWAAYQERVASYESREGILAGRATNSRNIGHSQLALIFALIGAMAGRALARGGEASLSIAS